MVWDLPAGHIPLQCWILRTSFTLRWCATLHSFSLRLQLPPLCSAHIDALEVDLILTILNLWPWVTQNTQIQCSSEEGVRRAMLAVLYHRCNTDRSWWKGSLSCFIFSISKWDISLCVALRHLYFNTLAGWQSWHIVCVREGMLLAHTKGLTHSHHIFQIPLLTLPRHRCFRLSLRPPMQTTTPNWFVGQQHVICGELNLSNLSNKEKIQLLDVLVVPKS